MNKNEIEKYIFNIPASSVTRNRALTAIFKFFDILVMFEIIKKNPATGTKRLILENKRAPVYLSEQKMKRMMELIDGKYVHRNLGILGLMAFCGLKVGKIHRLNVKDYDCDKKNKHIR